MAVVGRNRSRWVPYPTSNRPSRLPAIVRSILARPHYFAPNDDNHPLCPPKSPCSSSSRQLTASGERPWPSTSSPYFFLDSAKNAQTPMVLWIGCADSRVPESVVLAAKPGDLFVHRNIAKYTPRPPSFSWTITNALFHSQFHPNDDSALSVLTYAVEHVKVEHGAPRSPSDVNAHVSPLSH